MLILGAALATAATTDIIGGHATWQDAADMLKLVAVDVDHSVLVTHLDFGVYNQNAEEGVQLAVYEEVGEDGYESRAVVPATEVSTDGFQPKMPWSCAYSEA